MHKLYETYCDYFDLVALNTKGEEVYDEVVFIGIDAEWKQRSEEYVQVLSYQVASVSPRGGNNVIRYMPPGQRMSLVELVAEGLCSADE